jgi:hypothetical protein
VCSHVHVVTTAARDTRRHGNGLAAGRSSHHYSEENDETLIGSDMRRGASMPRADSSSSSKKRERAREKREVEGKRGKEGKDRGG